MKMINNYLSNLESYLPQELRQEVRDELEGSIQGQLEDQTEQLGRQPNEAEQAELLKGLGHPMRVAASYMPNQQLVGPELFPMFKKALQLTLFVFLTIQILFTIPDAFNTNSLIGFAIGTTVDLIHTSLWCFGVVTLIFYLIQVNNVNLDELYAWSPHELRMVSSKMPVSRVETLFELVAELVALAWWNNLLDWPSQIESQDVLYTVSMAASWGEVYWPVNILLLSFIGVNLYKLWASGWDKFSLVVSSILNVATLAVLGYIYRFESYFIATADAKNTQLPERLVELMGNAVTVTLAVIAIISVAEIIGNTRRLVKR